MSRVGAGGSDRVVKPYRQDTSRKPVAPPQFLIMDRSTRGTLGQNLPMRKSMSQTLPREHLVVARDTSKLQSQTQALDNGIPRLIELESTPLLC